MRFHQINRRLSLAPFSCGTVFFLKRIRSRKLGGPNSTHSATTPPLRARTLVQSTLYRTGISNRNTPRRPSVSSLRLPARHPFACAELMTCQAWQCFCLILSRSPKNRRPLRATATRFLNTQVPRETPIRSTSRQAKSKPTQSQKEVSHAYFARSR